VILTAITDFKKKYYHWETSRCSGWWTWSSASMSRSKSVWCAVSSGQ